MHRQSHGHHRSSSRSPRSPRSRRSRRSPGSISPASDSTDRSGIHILQDRSVAGRLVRSSGAEPDALVMEFGAGTGVLTAALAATGARVIAVERHTGFVSRLERRFGDEPGVRVVAADARTVMLPRRSFRVVANIPYAISTALLRRLMSPQRTGFTGADLVVEWGFAKRMTAEVPRDLETAWWQVRFAMSVAERIPARSFQPAPSVDSAHLVIRRRADVSNATAHAARAMLQARYRSPTRPAKEILAGQVTKKRAHRLLTSTGIDPPTEAAAVPMTAWMRIARDLSG